MIRLWIDDIRPAPEGWHHAKTCAEAIEFLENNFVDEVSFDHDSGDDDFDFIKVAHWLEESACFNTYHRVKWYVHSANPAGAAAIKATMERADKYWDENLANFIHTLLP